MAADINTQLQNISTDVTAIGNLVNRLTTIFSAGGVQNPDIAVTKAELQSWVQSNFAGLASTQVFTGFNTFNGDVSFVGRLAKRLVRNHQNFETYGAVEYLDSDVGVCTVSYSTQPNFGSWGDTSSYNVTFLAYNKEDFCNFICYNTANYGAFFCVPTTRIDNSNTNAAVNVEYLNNLNNSVLHKNGTETFYGVKTFGGTLWFSGSYGVCHKTSYKMSEHIGIEPRYNVFYLSRILDATTDTSVTLYESYYKAYATQSAFLHTMTDPRLNKSGGYNLSVDAGGGHFYVNGDFSCDGDSIPGLDNKYTLGTAARRWSEVFVRNSTINTSDERIKTDINDIPEAVLRAWGKVKFQQFKFKDSVDKKGSSARIHIGIIAQRIRDAFNSEGLDATKYGLFCYDSWGEEKTTISVLVKPAVKGMVKVVDLEAVYDTVIEADGSIKRILLSPEQSHMEEQEIEPAVYRDEEKVVVSSGELYSLRYEQCLCLECAYQRWRLARIEQKLGL